MAKQNRFPSAMLIKILLMALATLAPPEPEVIEVQDHNTPVIDLTARSTAKSDFAVRGVVLDAQAKLPLSEVVLIATSPALQGEETAVTDQNGEYEIRLPRGVYKIDLQREGYSLSTQLNVMIDSDSVIRMRLQLPPDPTRPLEYVEIGPCRSPIDTSSTATGRAFSRAELNLVPFGR